MPEEKVSTEQRICKHCGGFELGHYNGRCALLGPNAPLHTMFEPRPAADAGPRQTETTCTCWNRIGEIAKDCPVHAATPPVPQEAAPQPQKEVMPSESRNELHVRQVPNNPTCAVEGEHRASIETSATAPDSAMRVARQFCDEAFTEHNPTLVETWCNRLAALIRQAGSERERRLETALRNVRDRLQIIMAWPDEHWSKHLPIEIESELAEASRLLGGESK